MASYGSGVRLGAMATYVSREGDLALENERGELLQGRADLERLHEEWSPLFLNRNESRDIAGFSVEIEPTDQHDDESLHRLVRHTLQVAFGERRFA
ncbi:hypothetical protein [Rhizobium sp. SL86]|uniref:hypothetical protein n=1 Tax=Rhizobium sp. SL86 TaxID=2995148 RepID=UPI002273E3AC|nr:hypothetical protein [Rhizobium sp. SL86]MCY1667374.1 hypothetical protein [Rhizobium sp. SL86]